MPSVSQTHSRSIDYFVLEGESTESAAFVIFYIMHLVGFVLSNRGSCSLCYPSDTASESYPSLPFLLPPHGPASSGSRGGRPGLRQGGGGFCCRCSGVGRRRPARFTAFRRSRRIDGRARRLNPGHGDSSSWGCRRRRDRQSTTAAPARRPDWMGRSFRPAVLCHISGRGQQGHLGGDELSPGGFPGSRVPG